MSISQFVDPGFKEFGVDKKGLAPMTKFVNTTIRYPQKSIDKDDDYLEISLVKYKPPGFIDFDKEKKNIVSPTGSDKNSKQRIEQTIQLPIPSNIGDTNQVSWGKDEMNPLTATAAGGVSGVLGGASLENLQTIAQGLLGASSEVIMKGGAQDAIKTTVISKLVNSLGANTSTSGLISRATGQVLNPNLELLFSGVNLRSFSFDFDFTPRDSKESTIVKTIIRTFKIGMAPRTGGTADGAGLFISAPNVFILTYKSGKNDHPFLNVFKPCALVSMTTNYTGSGSYSTYLDKTPVHMKMSLGFTELNPIYYEDYGTVKGINGVGY